MLTESGVGRDIYKDPITDDGTKKSAKGLIKIVKENNHYKMVDQVTWNEEAQGALEVVFKDGKLLIDHSLKEVRENLKNA